MNNQLDNRFPKMTTGFLALLLIIIAVLAGYGETHATPAADPARPDPMASSNELVWVRQDPPIINVDDAPTYWESPPNDRFAGSYGQYTVTETEIAYHERWVDHRVEWYDVTLTTKFDRPPLVLNPPLRYKITANASHSGTHNYGSIGYQFWYNSRYGAVIEPHEVLKYYPFADDWNGPASKDWMINPPAILGEGDSFEIYAGWWNCPPCNITWTYVAEPANAVTQLGVEVVQPAVKYQGEEVPPGDTFFPENCSTTTTQSADSCDYAFQMMNRAQVDIACYRGPLLNARNLLRAYYGRDNETWPEHIILYILHRKLLKDCKIPAPNSSPSAAYQTDQTEDVYQIDLALEQGAVQLSNLLNRQEIGVKTPLGTAYTASRGAFLIGHSPGAKATTFRAYSTPLLLEPNSGSIMVLKPNQEVELTKKGFGPVKELPHVFLPMVINPR